MIIVISHVYLNKNRIFGCLTELYCYNSYHFYNVQFSRYIVFCKQKTLEVSSKLHLLSD